MYKNHHTKTLTDKQVGSGISFVDRSGHRVTGEITSISRRVSPVSGESLTVEVGVSAGDWENPQDNVYRFSAGDIVAVDDGRYEEQEA